MSIAGAYQTYVAETLRLLGENMARLSHGSCVTVKWQDILHPKPVETRTADEIISHVLGKLKGA